MAQRVDREHYEQALAWRRTLLDELEGADVRLCDVGELPVSLERVQALRARRALHGAIETCQSNIRVAERLLAGDQLDPGEAADVG